MDPIWRVCSGIVEVIQWVEVQRSYDGVLVVGSQRSYENLGEGVGAGAGDVALCGVKGHGVDGLVELPAVGAELLQTRPGLHGPETDRAVMTCRADHTHTAYHG